MKYRYQYIDEIVDAIEGATDPAIRMAIVWRNQDQPNLKALLELLYDYRLNFEVGGIPTYRRNRGRGIEFWDAVEQLDRKLNQRVLGAGQKFTFLVDILQQLQDRDAEVLERALRHQINLRIPLADIQRAFPDIKGLPLLTDAAPELKSIADLSYPGTIVKQPKGHEIRILVGDHTFKFIDSDARGLVFPDKPNSVFRKIFAPIKNVVFTAVFLGLTKEKDKIGNTATTNAAFAKFQAGELADETFCVRLIDAIDTHSYFKYPKANPRINMKFERRWNWLTKQDFGDNIFVRVADSKDVASVEDLKRMENDIVVAKETWRYYANNAVYADGFNVLDIKAF